MNLPDDWNTYLRCFSSPLRAGGVSGHLQRQWVLQLQPVPDSHSEQFGRDHAVLPHAAEERPAASHGEVSRLCQPVPEERSSVAGHQPGLWCFRGPGGTRQGEVQRQRLAWCSGDTQPPPGVYTSTVCEVHLMKTYLSLTFGSDSYESMLHQSHANRVQVL